MINKRISDTLIYQEYESDAKMFEALDYYLKDGYKIIKTIYLCPLVSNGKEEYLLSYIHVENPDENIEEEIKSMYQEYEVMKPDYSDTILNIIGGIRKNYGYDFKYQDTHGIFDKKYKNCIIMLLDGTGVNVLKHHLKEDSFLRSHVAFSEHAIYPSTTAASTTSTVSGLTPLESGWTGWENWIREMNRDIILFNGTNYYTGEKTGRTAYDLMPYKPFFHDMDTEGFVINPDFTKEHSDITDVLNESLKHLADGKPQVQYVYWTQPDGFMHYFGTYAKEITLCMEDLDKKVKEYAEKLPEDTLLVITADHGHTPVEAINFYTCKPLYELLEKRPSNDARCITFTVREGKKQEFESLFNSLFGSVYRLIPSSLAIREGYFGDPDGFIHERIPDFLGDFTACAVNKYYFNYTDEDEFHFKSHHAGITRDEMEVPVIIVRK